MNTNTVEKVAGFEHRVTEQSERIERREEWHITIDGYDISFRESDQRSELSIYPVDSSQLRCGIISCMPKTVADLEKLAAVATPLLTKLCAKLRELGKDDLRPKWEQDHEARLAKFMAEASQSAR